MTQDFDFNSPIDRMGQASQKWQRYERQDVIPMWVADMDLAAPPCVQARLRGVVETGVLGYGEVSPNLQETFLAWCRSRYGWAPKAEWLVWLPGVVPGINLAVEAWLSKEQGLTVQTPVYPPIRNLGNIRNRPQQTLPFTKPGPGHAWPLGTATLSDRLGANTRALVLCNPQNPLGRVYARAELNRIADLATARDLLVISDEIWADLILQEGTHHVPFAAVSADAAQRSITLMAASKTFNIAGLSCAVAIIPNADLRVRYQRMMRGLMPDVSYPGLLATQAAWQDGHAWLAALKHHLNANLERVEQWVGEHPGVEWQRPQATFVAWLDVRALGLADPARAFLKAGVALSDGAAFGCAGFLRLNFGCPKAQLEAALGRMSQVCK